MNKKHLIYLSFLALSLHTARAEDFRIYHIGNSLTWDSQPTVQKDILELNGKTVFQGYHIRCGAGLKYISENPDETCVESPPLFGKWRNALSNNEWDAITLQAYHGCSGQQEVAATSAMINTATSGGRNQNCVFWLYLAWEGVDESANLHSRTIKDYLNPNSSVELTSGFLTYWYNAIKALHPNLDIRVIPTGVSLATLDSKLTEIPIGNYLNANHFFRDGLHLTYGDGQNLATVFMVSCISGISPEKLVFPNYYSNVTETPIALLVNKVSWFTITSDLRTKVEDTPEIGIRKDAGGLLEVSFIGKLESSYDLINWNPEPFATSPHRVNPSNSNKMFFRAHNTP